MYLHKLLQFVLHHIYLSISICESHKFCTLKHKTDITILTGQLYG